MKKFQKMFQGKGVLTIMSLVAMLLFFSGCAGMQNVADFHGGAKEDVAMSESIFLSPTNAIKTVYISAQNTSKISNAREILRGELKKSLSSNGYQVVTKLPATYIIQVNSRYAGEYKKGMNFGGTLTGAGLGAMAGLGLTNNPNHAVGNTVGSSLIGAAVGLAFDVMTRTKTFVAVVDFQITENLNGSVDYSGAVVNKTKTTARIKNSGGLGSNTNAPEAVSVKKSVTSSKEGVKIYTAAVAAKAVQLNMSGGNPTKELLRKAAHQIAGVFP